MNYYKIFISIALVSFIILISINSDNKKSNRSNFESLLISEFNNMQSYSDQELENIPEPEHPHMSKFQNKLMTIDPLTGNVPIDRLRDAFIYTRNLQLELSNRDQMEWNNVASNMGGRTRTVMFDPGDLDGEKVWAGGVTGGLWYNNNITDITSEWEPVNDFWDNLSVSKIISDPQNNQIFYVGTGEANTAIITYRESSSRGVGIWKTVDGGDTWTLLSSTSDFEYITDIDIKIENDVSVIYAGVASGTYYGTHQSNPSDGLFRSYDGGITWEQVLPNIPGTNTPFAVSDIEIAENGRIFVGTMKNLNGLGGATILFSDIGNIESWNIYSDYQEIIESANTNTIPGRVVLDSSPSIPNIVYAVIGSGNINSMGFNLSYGNYIIRSGNGGQSWQQKTLPASGQEWASLAWHALKIAVSPDDHNTIFVGGLELYRSDDSGNTWQNLSDWDLMYYGGGDRYVHADIHDIVFSPEDSDQMVVTSDGGLFFSDEISSLNPVFIERNKGYNTLQFYTCDVAPELFGNTLFVGGLQDNGTLMIGLDNQDDNELDISDMITGGDGAYCFFDDNNPIVITSTYYNRYYIIDFQSGGYDYVDLNSGVFINPADYDHINNVIYANKVKFNGNQANRILRIVPSGNSYSGETLFLNTNSNVYFSNVTVSPFSTSESTTLFLGTQSGRLFKVENAQSSPIVTEIGSDNFPTGNVSSISIGSSENNILVTFSNYGIESVYYSSDGGQNWVTKESNLPDMPIRWSIFHPDSNDQALLATEIGVWYTTNLTDTDCIWYPSSNGLANVRIDMLSIRESDNMVLAASHGRGLFYGVYDLQDSFILGDINQDTSIDILDVVLLVNLILDNEFSDIADMNNDFNVDVLDVVILVNQILNN